ncbi:hypothetical protein GALL_41320 [mine drainage metagenome]|uniref:AMMECR1 domain-containing protein n=1 Tax=mine drainage metagenome TaxID=410659 RepID=A0A1J5TSL3_9ZZZZ
MSMPTIAFAGLAPHAPVLVPEVAGFRFDEVKDTVTAMDELAGRLVAVHPSLVLVVSPHSPRRAGAFGLWSGPRMTGGFSQFSAPGERIDLPVDEEAVAAIEEAAGRAGLRTWRISGGELDHGAAVPLWFLSRAGWRGLTVVVSLERDGRISPEDMGEVIGSALRGLGRRTALIASGDMSHRLCPGAPGGFDSRAHVFDEDFVQVIEQGAFARLTALDQALESLAAEDVVEPTRAVVAAIGGRSEGHRVLSYQAPFGVGYGVAVLYEAPEAAPPAPALVVDSLGQLPRVARTAIETHFSGGGPMPAYRAAGPASIEGCVFVTLFDGDGQLRGCIGSLKPTQTDLVHETWRYALAVLEDRRFAPVTREDLPGLRTEVTVLGELEPVDDASALDPRLYGLVVRAEDGRRGVLLPDLEGVDTVKQQLAIARRKAGIAPWEEVELFRFTAECFEDESPGGRS